MFFKVLLILTVYNFYKGVKSFLDSEEEYKEQGIKRSAKGYLSVSGTFLFYIMVLFVCFTPTILLWR